MFKTQAEPGSGLQSYDTEPFIFFTDSVGVAGDFFQD